MCGSTTLHGLVPTPSRALNNEVACKIEWWLKPSLDTCLSDRTRRRRAPQRCKGYHPWQVFF